ncbi:hypothetical protein [Burkholderia gladioli]|uniref:hypothetical protein n=1 Tax=Burkholderia gladioli TaxID=28095 RepID=UPI00163FC700|nr:hypothetical protein [Burkholderia gladioli]MDN7720115.1 hypothetical protein [Burkholderia gladioli]
MSLMSRYRDRWWHLNLFQKTQAIGKLALAVVVVVFLFVPHAWMASIWWLSIIPFGLLSIAYAIGLRSSLSQFIDSRLGITSRIALQALLVPISLGIARQYVADAFQLPPQSFDATVALLTVLVTPMLWFLLAAAVGVVTGTLCIIASMAGTLASPLFSPLQPVIGTHPWFIDLSQRYRDLDRKAIDHAGGSFASAVLIALIVGTCASAILKPNHIRLAAYYADFSIANRYPGLIKGRRMRLLDNGYVVYAERHGSDITIQVQSLPALSAVAASSTQ